MVNGKRDNRIHHGDQTLVPFYHAHRPPARHAVALLPRSLRPSAPPPCPHPVAAARRPALGRHRPSPVLLHSHHRPVEGTLPTPGLAALPGQPTGAPRRLSTGWVAAVVAWVLRLTPRAFAFVRS